MTTILYTPGSLTADSRERLQHNGEVTSDDKAKIYIFEQPIDFVVPYGNTVIEDTIEVGAGTGNAENVARFFKMLVKYGSEAYQRYLEMVDIFDNGSDVGNCTIVLVGRNKVHTVFLTERDGSFSILHSMSDLDEVRAWGTGGACAQFLAAVLKMPPELAVASTSIVDACTGGHITTVMLHVHDGGRTWREYTQLLDEDVNLLGELKKFFLELDHSETFSNLPTPAMKKPRTIILSKEVTSLASDVISGDD